MTFTLPRSIDVLQRTPLALRSLLDGLSDDWTHANYGPATFSPFDVVGHLIHADRTNWLTRARIILRQGEATPLPAFDRYAMYEANRGKAMAELLATFQSVRDQSLRELRGMNLTEPQLDLVGTHPELGAITLRQLLATWVVHDLNHLHQTARAMAFQYCDEVGPFRAYLSILPKG